jgi:hypothetical protein
VAAAFALAIAFASSGAAAADSEKRSLNPVDGRFHKIHTQNLKMGCGACHSAEQKDILFLRKDEPLPVGMPGQVDRHTCLSCHTKPAQPAWYGGAAK